MKKCSRCGEMTEGNFCTNCGAKMEEEIITEHKESTLCGQSQTTLDLLNKLNASKSEKKILEGCKKRKEKILAKISFGFSALFLYLGFYKMWVYENSDSYYSSNVNAYVGGDAYNYIINGTYATAFFVLTGTFLITGILLLILDSMKISKQ